MQQIPLIEDDPRRAPTIQGREVDVLRYAAGRPRGITSHGVMRDVVPHRNVVMLILASLARKGMLQDTGKRRNDCFIYAITEEGKAAI